MGRRRGGLAALGRRGEVVLRLEHVVQQGPDVPLVARCRGVEILRAGHLANGPLAGLLVQIEQVHGHECLLGSRAPGSIPSVPPGKPAQKPSNTPSASAASSGHGPSTSTAALPRANTSRLDRRRTRGPSWRNDLGQLLAGEREDQSPDARPVLAGGAHRAALATGVEGCLGALGVGQVDGSPTRPTPAPDGRSRRRRRPCSSARPGPRRRRRPAASRRARSRRHGLHGRAPGSGGGARRRSRPPTEPRRAFRTDLSRSAVPVPHRDSSVEQVRPIRSPP